MSSGEFFLQRDFLIKIQTSKAPLLYFLVPKTTFRAGIDTSGIRILQDVAMTAHPPFFPRRDPDHESVARDIFGDHRPCSDGCVPTDGDAPYS